MIEHKAFERMISAGLLEVYAVHLDGTHWVESRIDGKKHACTLGISELAQPKEINGRTYTHYHGSCAITTDEAALVDAALERVVAEYNATPEGLIRRRRMLVEDIGYARSADRERREHRWEQEDEQGWATEDADGKVAAAEQALADFDAAHPEVAAAWDAKDESRRAAMLADQIAYVGE